VKKVYGLHLIMSPRTTCFDDASIGEVVGGFKMSISMPDIVSLANELVAFVTV
jgi:hypothetical protein